MLAWMQRTTICLRLHVCDKFSISYPLHMYGMSNRTIVMPFQCISLSLSRLDRSIPYEKKKIKQKYDNKISMKLCAEHDALYHTPSESVNMIWKIYDVSHGNEILNCISASTCYYYCRYCIHLHTPLFSILCMRMYVDMFFFTFCFCFFFLFCRVRLETRDYNFLYDCCIIDWLR